MKPTIKEYQNINYELENKKQPSKPNIMKKLLLLLLLFTGMVNAQPPVINTPQNQTVFDFDNNSYELFEVYSVVPEILGSLNPNDFNVKFYSDTLFQNLIAEDAGGFTYYSNNQTVYVKVTENANQNNFATTSFSIILIPTPVIGLAQDIFQMDIPFDSYGTFDLTTQTTAVLNGLTGVTLNYYPSLEDANVAQNVIVSPSNYTNITNPQYIYARVTNTITGAYSLRYFRIVLTSAEVITIPDPYFRQRLDVHDTNQDGAIQLSEALSVTQLDLSNPDIWNYPVADLTGIENFSNVTQLFLGRNPLGSVNLSSLTKLEYLDMPSTNNTSLNVSGLIHLKSINCDTGQLTSIDVSSCLALEYLFCARNQISTLNINGLTNIKNLSCNNNLITTINVSNLINMTSLCCSDNLLTSLDLSGLTNIVSLCYGNQSMNAVDTSHLTNLVLFAYGGGNATTLDFSTLTNLKIVWAWNSNLSSLDISNLPLVDEIRLAGNNDLTYLNMKNGGHFRFSPDPIDNFSTKFWSNPNLFYVCTNEVDQVAVNNELSVASTTNGSAHANTYCTFVPGGNYNTITGNTTFDSNNNGCDVNDISHPNVKVKINDGTNQGETFSLISGLYNFYTLAGSFEITPENENPSWFNFSPSSITIPFADNNNNIATQNFCVTANGVHPDLEVVLSPDGQARPGFDAKYKLIFKNKGNQSLTGTVNLIFDDTHTDFVSAFPIVDNQVVNSLSWSYSNLLPFETRVIDLVLNVNSPMEIPAVNGGDILPFSATINPVASDELPLDNIFDLNQIVVNSLDPNAITCLEGETVAPEKIGEYLHYSVQFENVGTASAVNIVVKDIIDTTKFDVSTLQVISASASERTVITGNVVEFIFENINLDRHDGNPPVGGHGDILFKIKTKDDLVTGDTVVNNANIYFDYNFPIGTGDANTVFAALKNATFTKDESISIFPNPTSSRININSNFNIKKIEMYDVQGRVLETILGNTKTLDIADKTNGIYFFKITTDKGSKVEKVVKE